MAEDRRRKADRQKRQKVDRKQKAEDRRAKLLQGVKDLKVYQLSSELAVRVFEITKRFPKEESYSLTDQIRRSSRSVTVNIREGFAKRRYKPVFTRHLVDALGSNEETREWLNFSLKFQYITQKDFDTLDQRHDEVTAMLYSLIKKI